jgi:hypothetical protein
MRRSSSPLAAVLIMLAAMPASASGIRLGVTGGGGLSLAGGSFLDMRAEQLAVLGASTITTPGTIRGELFPGWSAGVFIEGDLGSRLAVRLESRVASGGAARLAVTQAGLPFDRYGASWHSVMVPVLLEGRFALGPGYLTGSAGAFPALIVGPVAVSDRYASMTTTAPISQSLPQGLFLGACAGVGYTLVRGRMLASLEARADVAFTPASSPTGGVGATIFPGALSVVASFGFSTGGSR